MKKNLVLLAFLIGGISFLPAQGFLQLEAEDISLDPTVQEEMASVLADYQSVYLPTDEILAWGRSFQAESKVSLQVGSESYSLLIHHHDLLSPNFRAVMIGKNGSETLVTEGLVLRSFRGYLEKDPESTVRMTITNVGLDITIDAGDQRLRLTALRNFGRAEQDPNIYLLFDETALIAEGFCGNELTQDSKGADGLEPIQKPTPNAPQQQLKGAFGCPETQLPPSGTRVIADCDILQVAADADNEFVAFQGGGLGGAFASFATMFNTIDAAEPAYEANFDLSFQVTRLGVFFTAPDPYININLITGNSGDLNVSIGNVWAGIPQATTPRDIVILFTGLVCQDILPSPPFPPGILATLRGRANAFNSVCTNANAFVTDCAFTDGQAIPVLAHEIGHTFGALHPNGDNAAACGLNPCNLGAGNNSLMCNGNCPAGDVTFMDNGTINTIQAHINNVTCLNNNNTDPGDILGPDIVCLGANSTFNLDLNHVAGGGIFVFPNHTWSVGPGLTLVNAGPFNATVTASTTSGFKSWVEVSLDGVDNCNLRLRKEVVVNSLPVFCWDYELCPSEFEGIITVSAPAGVTIGNIQCLSNCGNISTFISNFGNSAFVEVFSGQPGTYLFTYTVSNSCGTFTHNFNITIPNDCRDIFKREGVDLAETLSLYPNPASNLVNLVFPNQNAESVSIQLLDAKGAMVREVEVLAHAPGMMHTQKLSLAGLTAGIYLVKVKIGNRIMTEKLFVE